MKCPNCNSIINEGESFCILCGYSFDQHEPINQNQPVNQEQIINQQPVMQQQPVIQQQPINQQTQQNNSLHSDNTNNSNVENNNAMQTNNLVNIQSNVQQEQQVKSQTINNNYSQTTIIDDYYKENMLYDAYIGKRIDELKNGGFSWNTYVFRFSYMIYRKMWAFAMIYFLIVFITIFIFKTGTLQKIIIEVINICAGWMFKESYLSHVEKKVRKIKGKNTDKTHEELMKICKKKGGTSILSVILTFGVMIITTVLVYTGNFNKIIYNIIKLPSTITNGKMIITIPYGFQEKNNNFLFYTTKYEDKSSNSDCELTISTTNSNGITTAIKGMENLREFHKSTNPIEEKNINGNTWVYMTIDNTHYYMIIYDNKFYDLDYKIISEDKQKKCSKFHSKIIESIKFN